MKYFSEGILDVAGSGQIGNCDYAHVDEAGSLREGMEEQDGRRSRTDMRSEPVRKAGIGARFRTISSLTVYAVYAGPLRGQGFLYSGSSERIGVPS
jgi:hypothetical protein